MLFWRSGYADTAEALVEAVQSRRPRTALVLHTIRGSLSCFSWLSSSWLHNTSWYGWKQWKIYFWSWCLRRRAWLRLIALNMEYGCPISGGGPDREGEKNWTREHWGWRGWRNASYRAVISFLILPFWGKCPLFRLIIFSSGEFLLLRKVPVFSNKYDTCCLV